MVTLSALCSAHQITLSTASQTEFRRIWKIADQIREKQAGKPLNNSPLPGLGGDA